MATKSWNQFYVLCPFFLNDDGRGKIVCEGICDSCKVNLTFENKSDFQIQLETFCKEHYKRCEVYRAAMEKYND